MVEIMGFAETFFGTGADDPRSQAMAALSAGLLQGNFGAGIQNASNVFADQKKRALAERMAMMQLEQNQMQLDKAKREQSQEDKMLELARGAYRSPEMANAMSQGPSMTAPMASFDGKQFLASGGAVPQVSPGFDAKQFLSQYSAINPLKAMEMGRSMTKAEAPLTVAAGASLVDPKTFKPIFTNPKEDASPSAVREYEYAKGQGYKGTYEQWTQAQKRAGASNTNISVSTEKSLLNDIASGLGKGITDAKGQAQAALSTIGTVNRLNDALDSGKVMAGPGTTFRQMGIQIGSVLGVSGKDAQEKMLNTRQAIQSLAQLELDAAQQMKGQGQITEAERAIIRRAASGDIDGMTTGELRLLGGILDRTARTKIRGYNQQVAPLKSMPNAAPLSPFLDVQEPPARATGGGGAKFLGFE
jgi:hypothetical protein